MRPERLVRHYGKLAPAERFRLAVRALARDDFDELRQLRTTCPTKTYKASDADYSDRMDAARTLVFVFSADMARTLGKLEMAYAVTEVAPVITAKVRGALLRDIQALWAAFATFSREEMGLEPEATLGAWARPVLELIQASLDGTEPGEPDPRSDSWAGYLSEIWRAENSH